MKSKILCMLSILFCLFLFPSVAFAAQRNVEVELPVKVSIFGEGIPVSDTYTFRISAKNSAPLPNGDSYMDVSIQGAGTLKVSHINFEQVGIYQYSVSQIAGTEERCNYDQKVYDITVTVTNAGDDSLEATIAIRDCDSDMKVSGIEFNNYYKTLPELPETGGNGVFQMYLIGTMLLMGSLVGTMSYKKHRLKRIFQ